MVVLLSINMCARTHTHTHTRLLLALLKLKNGWTDFANFGAEIFVKVLGRFKMCENMKKCKENSKKKYFPIQTV